MFSFTFYTSWSSSYKNWFWLILRSVYSFRFPTIYWAPMGSKDSPKKYQGGREVSDFIEFIKKEATNPVEIGEKKKKKKKVNTDL